MVCLPDGLVDDLMLWLLLLYITLSAWRLRPSVLLPYSLNFDSADRCSFASALTGSLKLMYYTPLNIFYFLVIIIIIIIIIIIYEA